MSKENSEKICLVQCLFSSLVSDLQNLFPNPLGAHRLQDVLNEVVTY